MAHTTCQGIDPCTDPGDPPLVRCRSNVPEGEKYCARHGAQTARQDALISVLRPKWWMKLKGGQPQRRRDPKQYKTDARDETDKIGRVDVDKIKVKKRNPLTLAIPSSDEARRILLGKGKR